MLRRVMTAVSGVAIAVAISGIGFAGTAFAAPPPHHPAPPPPHRDLGRQFNTTQDCQAEARREHRPIDCRLAPDHHWHLWG
jgi:hypothetical protein